MLLAFIGDVHGKIFHLLALLSELQHSTGSRIDYFIQLGDLGVFPDESYFTEDIMSHLQNDKTELQFSKLVHSDDTVLSQVNEIKEYLGGPVYTIRGNHEDFAFLSKKWQRGTDTIDLDPVGIFRMVRDGLIIEASGISIGFLGGIESQSVEEQIDAEAVKKLKRYPKRLDVLVTHQNPYGAGRRFHGQTGGSHLMTDIVKELNPRYLFYGHTHRAAGPYRVFDTFALGVDGLMPLLRDTPEHDIIPGCIALLDTDEGIPYFAHHEWFLEYHRKMRISELLGRALAFRERGEQEGSNQHYKK